MAGWGNDPELEELRRLIYEDGREPVRATIRTGPRVHHSVEGLREDNPNLPL